MTRSSSPSSAMDATPWYPMRASLNFYPGGLRPPTKDAKPEDNGYFLGILSTSGGSAAMQAASPRSSSSNSLNGSSPVAMEMDDGSNYAENNSISSTNNASPKSVDDLVHEAKVADDRLHKYALLASKNPSTRHHLPSLSVLAGAAFGRLTGIPPGATKAWADAMVLQYLEELGEDTSIPTSEAEIWKADPNPAKRITETTSTVLKKLLQQAESHTNANDVNSPSFRPRPCGYVFKRGDIAWNCRTCQTDSTCVICDSCFRDSKHVGHEVYFHRTTPGGCCDCGDAEAWKADGCCDSHRPKVDSNMETTSADDPEEAVRMAAKGLQEGVELLTNSPTALPPKFAAALGVVIGAAVNCLTDSVDGAGIAADTNQWALRWSDEAARIWNAAAHDQDYNHPNVIISSEVAGGKQTTETTATSQVCPRDFLESTESENLTALPKGFKLHLRLHNDDVHTFDEVIEALYKDRHSRRNQADADNPENQSLVNLRDVARQMTLHVDSDGQVLVKDYIDLPSAIGGFRKLKSKGLHCAVASTAQVDSEHRARVLSAWLADVSSAHPAAAVLVVHALVQASSQHMLAGIPVWHQPHTIPVWSGSDENDDILSLRKRFNSFPPHLSSSYVTHDEAEKLHSLAIELNSSAFVTSTGASIDYYSGVPYRMPSRRYCKSPHALWGTLPSLYTDQEHATAKHPFLFRLSTGQYDETVLAMPNKLTENVYVVDTDLRKQQEADRLTKSVAPHRLPGLHLISGVGLVQANELGKGAVLPPDPMEWRHLLATSSFRAPISPIVLLLLLDPYPTKQLRSAIHALFLSLLTDARFKCRFAAALGIAYRPLSTLYCAGVGTDADTPLGFTVQIFTAGSLVRALGSAPAVEKLLKSDDPDEDDQQEASIGTFTMPIAQKVVRCIHTNLLGSTKEVQMILNNTSAGNDGQNDALLPALTYVAGEHPLMTALPAAPDDGFIDSRSTRHKRLPHLLRDLEYVIETPGTALRLLLPSRFPSYQGISLSSRGEEILAFATTWARLLRLAQGMDPQKRKISAGHVEYEQNRWLEAFGLSLNFAGTLDALAESPTNSTSAVLAPVTEDGSHLISIREAMGNVIAALLKELKLWLYREGTLETGLPVPTGGANGAMDIKQVESLQRSTLHVSASQLASASDASPSASNSVSTVALSCATGVKMTEAQLDLIESALKTEGNERQYRATSAATSHGGPSSGTVMGDWLRVPHSPLAGDSLSFHLPLHRAIAKTVRSACSVVVPESIRESDPHGWWKLPVLDEEPFADTVPGKQHPLVPLIRPILRSANCRVVWSSPDCSPQDAQRRRARSRAVSANIAVAKIIHSLADHPVRCLAAAQQIERHLWARNGASTAGMALNYSVIPLCRSFRDLDVTLIQLSAAGMSAGLGARRIFNLLISRFSMDGYLCDPERRASAAIARGTPYSTGLGLWINPPRLQDPEHAMILSESFFSTLCVIVTELPSPPPIVVADETWLRQSIKRELIHALAAEPRSHSAAQAAASCAVNRRDESDGSVGTGGGGGLFRDVFSSVLKEVGKQKGQSSSRSGSAPAAYELKADCCDEYDPTFFHLRRQEHQHAMDVIAMLRKQKLSKEKSKGLSNDARCLPIVCAPPKAHPRFLPSRLLLHLPSIDAAIRRYLLFALTAGSWLPPSEPVLNLNSTDQSLDANGAASAAAESGGDAPAIVFSKRAFASGSLQSTSFQGRGSSPSDSAIPPSFSEDTVSTSSVSFLEVLQLLTLQVHTLEECASLHIEQSDLDDEAKSLSAGLSINSYLGRLVRVPESLVDVWALRPYPDGPLRSTGSGEKRGSILGLLVALYEHRGDHATGGESNGGHDPGVDGHGGARSLASSGLKWLLRFVNALVDGASSVAAASKSASNGIPVKPTTTPYPSKNDSGMTIWTIDDTVRFTISAMLAGLADLWPKPEESSPEKSSSTDMKNKERGRAAQKKMLEMMRKKQSAFVDTMDPAENPLKGDTNDDEENDLCIICRCDDADGENNGPLGYLGHVQRSRVAQMRACNEALRTSGDGTNLHTLFNTYRVVGHMGCQLRATEAMDSNALTCLPQGSLVRVLKSTVSDEYDILSRRVFVEHESEEDGHITKGWASVQSSQGYVILSPLVSVCYESTRWGSTRPIIRQCGHAAHLRCVETHTLSLHQRAAGEQPYDGRFAANIDDGEFLCPLCKQLSNILIPRDGCAKTKMVAEDSLVSTAAVPEHLSDPIQSVQRMLAIATSASPERLDRVSDIGKRALSDFGAHLLQAMDVPWERASGARKGKHRRWHAAIQRWDYEEEDDDTTMSDSGGSVGSILRLLRQQHIAWAAVGHSAAAAEASTRGIEEVLPFGSFSKTDDPWADYTKSGDASPSVMELKRTLTGAAGLLEVLVCEMARQLSDREISRDELSILGKCLGDIVNGDSWMLKVKSAEKTDKDRDELLVWSQLTSLMVSTPCHVARDGMIAQRREARSAAAAMWTVRGVGTDTARTNGDPPTPYAIEQVTSKTQNREVEIPRNWGTLSPFVDTTKTSVPFRPAVASSFLYIPLLSWDMNTLAGAVFSSIMTNDNQNAVTSQDLLNATRLLIFGRLVQCVITPYGFDVLHDAMDVEAEDEDEENHWKGGAINSEGAALVKLLVHCRSRMAAKSLDPDVAVPRVEVSMSPPSTFGSVSRAILPFSRSVILILRACVAVINERQRKDADSESKNGESDSILNTLLEGSDSLTTNDGLFIFREIGGPMPTCFAEHSSPWWSLANRWLTHLIGFEMHHGSDGKSLISHILDTESIEVPPHPPTIKTSDLKSTKASAISAQSSAGNNESSMVPSAPAAGNASESASSAFDGEDPPYDPFGQDGSDEDLITEDGEEMVDIEGQFLDAPAQLMLGRHGRASSDVEDSGMDDPSTSGSDGEGDGDESAYVFANVSQSPILSHQPSVLALDTMNSKRRGTSFDRKALSSVMADLSLLGLTHQRDMPTFSLVRLPKSFVELYGLVNKVKGREEATSLDENDDGGNAETAICLLTGSVMRSGSARKSPHRSPRPPGACTLHARKNGSGIGIFFLVQKCTVLLMHNNKSAYSPSLFVDDHGEEDPGLRRGRPLFLNAERYRALELLWRQQGIPREVAQIRSTSDRVIRDNWY